MKLEGKVAIVTGAGGSLGETMSLALAAEGCDIAGLDVRSDSLQPVMERIRSTGRRALGIEVDLRLYQPVQAAIARVYAELGQVDILVNNAGKGQRQPFVEVTEEIWDSMMATNLKTIFNCCKAVVPRMIEQRSGRIINISSVAALRGSPMQGKTAYAAAKGGVISLTKSMARELAPYGICVTCIAPGYQRTSRNLQNSAEVHQSNLRQIPMGRMGEPEELAQTVVFLASPTAGYITGIVLPVDGGCSMH